MLPQACQSQPYSPTKPYWGALPLVCPWIIFLPGLPSRQFFHLELPSSRTLGFKTGLFMYHFLNVVQSSCPDWTTGVRVPWLSS